jgi:hypothetical protein
MRGFGTCAEHCWTSFERCAYLRCIKMLVPLVRLLRHGFFGNSRMRMHQSPKIFTPPASSFVKDKAAASITSLFYTMKERQEVL